MSSSKRINYLPEQKKQASRPENRFGPLVITLLTCGCLVWFAIPDLPPPVHAEAVAKTPSLTLPDGSWVISESDPLHPFFTRAEGWFPWDQVLVSIGEAAAKRGSLKTVSYTRDIEQLEILGSVDELPSLADFVVDLARWSFLVDAEPHDLVRAPGDSRTRFTLRLKVAPPVRRESLP